MTGPIDIVSFLPFLALFLGYGVAMYWIGRMVERLSR